MGFCTTACITQPQSASPLPARKPRIILGTRICQTICSIETGMLLPLWPKRWRCKTAQVVSTGIRTAPIQSVTTAEASAASIRQRTSHFVCLVAYTSFVSD